VFKQAERKRARLRLGITGPSGSGKTLGALLVASGLGKVAMLDTEEGSGELYSGQIGYLYDRLAPPFTPERYIAKMKEVEKLDVDVLILDSISHAWEGTGGILDMHDRAVANNRNSFAAWREVTPKHNQFVDAMLRCPYHLIATMRSKSDYITGVDGSGRMSVRKVGLAPIQRPGMEYEFTTVFDLDMEHRASVSKDRTSLFDGKTITLMSDVGRKFAVWLNEGMDTQALFQQMVTEIGQIDNLDWLRTWYKDHQIEIENLPNSLEIITMLTQRKEMLQGEMSTMQ